MPWEHEVVRSSRTILTKGAAALILSGGYKSCLRSLVMVPGSMPEENPNTSHQGRGHQMKADRRALRCANTLMVT